MTHLFFVPAEGTNVQLDPLQRSKLILEGEIQRALHVGFQPLWEP